MFNNKDKPLIQYQILLTLPCYDFFNFNYYEHIKLNKVTDRQYIDNW